MLRKKVCLTKDQSTLSNFFAKSQLPANSQLPDIDSTDVVQHLEMDESYDSILSNTDSASSNNPHDIVSIFSKTEYDWERDRKKKISDLQKQYLLLNHIMPDSNFKYPYSVRSGKCSQKVYLSLSHLTGKNHAFKYSFEMQGVVCVPCVLFANIEVSNDRGKSTKLGALVLHPFRNYKKVHEKLRDHLRKQYHVISQERADLFLNHLVTGNSLSIINQLSDTRRNQVLENRQRLIPIVKTIIFCGRLGIALRGHNDDGIIDIGTAISGREGNFRALLAFRVDSGDSILEEHLNNSNKNATYVSKTIQNRLIKLCGDQVLEKIVDEVKESIFFSILADETTDSSHQEQLCIVLRYVSSDFVVKEEFVGFGSVDNLSANSITHEILERLGEMGLNIRNCVGQGYDGASSFSGYLNGVAKQIKESAPMAVYVHCASHVLNLVLNESSSVPSIRNMFDTISNTITFVNESSKRKAVFHVNLINYCTTRFIQRHDAIVRFSENFENVIHGLEDILADSEFNSKTRSLALSHLNSLKDSTFLIALASAKKVMSLTMILSRILQQVNLDFCHVFAILDATILELQTMLDDKEEKDWNKLENSVYKEAERYAVIAGVIITAPRQASHHIQSVSYSQSAVQLTYINETIPINTEQFFKCSVWYPFLSTVIDHLTKRFSKQSRSTLGLFKLINSESIDTDILKEIYNMYEMALNCQEEELFQELKLYQSYRKSIPLPDSLDILHLLQHLSPIFTKLKIILQIAVTLPITTCSAERSFSAMKILKSYIRSTMTDDRLTGLALMYIHKDIPLDVVKIINTFAISGDHRMNFVI
ncbi:52 kDa repressor of the inhibitor of the protein kinase-like [Oopsacas minuta]|uniref:52 kDa repressor of the inhibitor of the protein kinase-like n=1 Tax=Oopsacas minuta TaxID=111878 RepID=A0AAV7JH42_9METZ|nr:52 kDa repressor of the inhibitor of the protein kinase-like [Oopsacas minuta]